MAVVQGAELVYIAALGSAAGYKGKRTATVMSFTGVVMLSGKPRAFAPDAAPTSSRNRANAAGIRSGLVVPIAYLQKAIGTLGLVSERKDAFSDDDGASLKELIDLIAERLAGAQQAEAT